MATAPAVDSNHNAIPIIMTSQKEFVNALVAQLPQLRRYAIALAGNAAFADAATNEIVSLFNGNAPKTLPPTYPLYSSDFKPQYRSFNILTIANPLAPQLQAVEQNGRVVAYLSREDLTAGILGVPTDGITGYKPESARRLVANIAASCEAKVK